MASRYEPRTVEGILRIPVDIGRLCGIFTYQTGECSGGCMGGICTTDEAILHYLLHMDIKPTIYGEAEEMDVDSDDSDVGIMDILSSRDNSKWD